MLGEPDFLKDPKWNASTAQSDPNLVDEFNAYFLGWCLDHTKKDLWEIAQAAGVISAPLNTMEDVLADPVFAERGAFAGWNTKRQGRCYCPAGRSL